MSFRCRLQCQPKSTIIVKSFSVTTVLEFDTELGQNTWWALCIDGQTGRQTNHLSKSRIKIKSILWGYIWWSSLNREGKRSISVFISVLTCMWPMNLTKDKCDWVQHIYQACNSLPSMQKTKNRIKERSSTHKPMKGCSMRLVRISIAIAQNDKHIREKTGEW